MTRSGDWKPTNAAATPAARLRRGPTAARRSLSWIPDSAAEEVALRRVVLDMRRRLAPENAELIRGSVYLLAHAHWLRGDLAIAEELAREAVALTWPNNGVAGDSLPAHALRLLAVLMRERGELAEAEKTLRLAISLANAAGGSGQVGNLRGGLFYDLAATLHLRGDREGAANCEAQAAELFGDASPVNDLSGAHRFETMGRHMLIAGAHESAANALRSAVEARAAICPGHPTLRAAENLLLVALAGRGDAAAPDDPQPTRPDDPGADRPP